MKTTLAIMGPSTPNSAAHRETSPLPSGGLELTRNVFGDTTLLRSHRLVTLPSNVIYEKKKMITYR